MGTLLDQQTRRPLAGGVLSVLETGEEVRSESDGSFELPVVEAGEVTIRVQAPGYSAITESVEITPGEAAFVQIQLLPLSAMLDEVMVLTGRGSIGVEPGSQPAEITPGTRAERALTAADLLASQVPGLTATRSGGSVGAGSRVRIRGVSTIKGSTAPLIYLDGVRISDGTPSANRPSGVPALAILDEIPASQVKRIRVLRGSSAGAMYGDSANGVILIETHRGREP